MVTLEDQFDRTLVCNGAACKAECRKIVTVLPATRVQFGLGAVLQHSNTPTLQHSNTPTLQHSNTPTLQHSNTPTLRAAAFEDEDDDEDSLPDEALPSSVGSFVSERSRENEAPCEGEAFGWKLPRAEAGLKPWAMLLSHFMAVTNERELVLTPRFRPFASFPVIHCVIIPVVALTRCGYGLSYR